MSHIRPALVLIAVFTLLTGLAFPLAFVGVATALVPDRANGSMVARNGTVVGSALIGQNFTGDGYFHPRPSATNGTDPADASKTVPSPYNASGSGGSNAGPTNKALIDRVAADVAASGPAPVPADMVTTSASGLDPDISPENAARQVARVAAARKMPEPALASLVAAHTKPRLLGVFGAPRINVLLLNLALDAAASS